MVVVKSMLRANLLKGDCGNAWLPRLGFVVMEAPSGTGLMVAHAY